MLILCIVEIGRAYRIQDSKIQDFYNRRDISLVEKTCKLFPFLPQGTQKITQSTQRGEIQKGAKAPLLIICIVFCYDEQDTDYKSSGATVFTQFRKV